MSLDNVSYYDFDSEIKVKNWTPVSIGEDSFSFRSEFEASAGEYLLFLRLAFGVVDAPRIVFRKITLNGSTFDSAAAPAVYTAKGGGSRKGIEVTLQEGANTIEIEGIGPTAYINDFMNIAVSFGKPQTKVAPTAKFHAEFVLPEPVFPEPGKVLLPGGFIPGIGCTESPGRFGFSKGDGVLDCAMPTLGCIDKMYMCGHPQYQKPFRWNYSTLPEGAPHHGTYVPANTGIDGDEVKINHLSVRWTTEFIDEKFACTYSLASPGIITERESGSMRISGLEFAGNYQYAMLPRANSKIEVTSLRDIADIRLGANWMLLFGCTEFPDIPLLLVFQKQPENMRLKFSERTGRLAEIAFENCPLLISATPFGFESFQPIPPEDSAFLHRAAVRCRFWSRAFLAYPVRCEEYFKNDYAAKKTTILQKFSYRYIADAWGTAPLELAPIPPAAQLSGLLETTDQVDFEFPTKYGNLTGAFGNQSSYALPFMPSARKFPLKDKSSDALKKLLEDGLDSYFDFVTSFPDTFQAYPYAGSLMEPFALTTSLLFFMDESHRERLRTLVGERLEKACDPERDYNYAVINHGFMMKTEPDDEQLKKIYADPAMAYKRLWNWYLRSEPFTGIKFHICYLNVCFLSSGAIKDGTPEEIAALKIPLIENDWGVGLAFYYMHLCALASGDFASIRKNWPLLKSVYSFFEKMHDWACLGTGYSDNAILWVEGANYGAFTSFIQMAEAVGDRETMEKAQYMAAKQFALRMAIVRSARQHFCKYYKVEPWDITRIFTEEMNPQWQYQGVPHHLGKKRFRSEGVYTLTTEGMYPEFFEGLRQFLPDEAKTIMTKLGSWLHEDAADSVKHSWSDMQKTACYLIDLALDENASSEKLKEEIAFAKSIGLLMTKWRGIHIFSRRLPEHYFETQLLAWDAMKEHPVWLEYWYGLKIESAEWDGKFAEISFQTTDSNAVLRFGIRKKPLTVTENGERLHLKADEKTIEIHPRKSGTILLEFDAPIFGCGQNKLELTSTTHTGGNSFAQNKLFSIRNTGVSNMIQFPQWGCFFDFHTMPSCPQVGENFDVGQFIKELKSANIDFIVFPARCNLGMAYYNTRKGIRHPSLEYDLFGRILEACRQAGIRCSAYLNVGLSHEEGLRHRDWLTTWPDGSAYKGDRMNNFFRRMCYNSPYADHFCSMLQELTDEYAPDGFFFDCATINPCIGCECIREMKERGIDWQNEKAVFEFARLSRDRFCQRIANQIKQANPNALLYFNGLTFQQQADLGNYLEFEALGRAIYESLPVKAHYARKLNKPVLNMIGRFHKSWADFGGICSADALEYFLGYGLANTMRCTVGDHFHPRGDIQKPVFDLIRTVYGKLQRFSDCYQDAEAVTEFALLTPEYAFDYSTLDGQKALFALWGAAQMFDQMHLLYDVITPDMDFSAYRVLVLLDETRIDPQTAERIKEFLQNGGKVFCCGQGGLALGSDQMLLPLPVQCQGTSPCNPAYISVKAEVCPEFPEMPVTLYHQGMSYRAQPGADILASIIKPMVEHGWDGEHGNYYTPPDKENGDAAVIESDNGILFSHPLFQTYRECSQPCFLQLTKTLLKRLLPESILEIRNFPGYCRTTLTRQKNRLHLHLMNFHPESPSPSVVLVEPPGVLTGIEVRLNMQDKTPTRIYWADTGKELPWQKTDRQIQFEIDRLQGYQVLTIEFV